MERVKGIEPSSQAWEARILPLDHTRNDDSVKPQGLDVKPGQGLVITLPMASCKLFSIRMRRAGDSILPPSDSRT